MMNSKHIYPLVSVAIITYNQKEYLEQCIESVLQQDYKNFEIIVADDASTDGTQDMLKNYASIYPEKFKLVLSPVNQGITKNSNTAFFACNGKYIALIGGDDLLLPGKISKQVDFLEKNQSYALCGSYTKLIDSAGKSIGLKKDSKKKSFKKYSLKELIESGNYLVPVVSYMFRRDSAPKDGFDLRLPVASDCLFMYQVANKGRIYILNEPLTAYRIHYSHAKNITYFDDLLVSLALCNYYFPECYPEIKRSISRTYYRIAKNSLIQNDIKKAKIYLHMSIMESFNLLSGIILLLLVFKQNHLILNLYHKLDPTFSPSLPTCLKNKH